MSIRQPDRREHVVIVGGGFAGLAAAQRLKRANVDITLVDRRNFHLFQPLLYQVATGELSPSNIASPLRGILRRQKNTKVLMGNVVGFDLDRNVVELASGELNFDHLIVATGSTHHYFGNEQWRERAPGLKTVEDATEIRRRILAAFEAAERAQDPDDVRKCLTFVIVGAGPTGCELAGALAEVAHNTMAKDFRNIDPKTARILLIEPSEHPLNYFPAPLPQKANEALERLGVDVMRGYHVTDIGDDSVQIRHVDKNEQSEIFAHTVIWAAGVRGSSLGKMLCDEAGLEHGRAGRVSVLNDCSLPGYPSVFVCGDLAIFEGEDGNELPCLAPVAGQMGKHAAECIIRDQKNRPRKPLRYLDKGSLAVIGRYRAVGSIGKLKMHGPIAWALWLFVHLMFITRFRNRLLVLIQWGWAFFTHDRSSRLITGETGNVGDPLREFTESDPVGNDDPVTHTV
ncbi:MAG: NAD(P)/FAD-dependent oxidoreductase [Planctomycetota bacterium]